MEVLRPSGEADVAAAVRAAFAAREPLAVEGAGTKRGMLRPVQAARTLSTQSLTGVTLYAPKELIISAWAGTPVRELEPLLAEHGQQFIAEPPNLNALLGSQGEQTIGGVVATNLSGPRRVASGATRDHVMGVRAVDGTGEVFHSGGRVLKNVTGLDLCKLLTGSHGTLAVITEVTLKVLPAPEASATIVIGAETASAGVAALATGLGSPFGVSGAAWIPDGMRAAMVRGPAALLRIEDFVPSVEYRVGCLSAILDRYGDISQHSGSDSQAIWRAVRDAEPLAPDETQAVWRASVRPSNGPALLENTGLRGFLDWGGGLVWLTGPPERHGSVMGAIEDLGGTWTVMRAPDSFRVAAAVARPDPPALAAIGRRVKAVMDPAGILNPNRLFAGV